MTPLGVPNPMYRKRVPQTESQPGKGLEIEESLGVKGESIQAAGEGGRLPGWVGCAATLGPIFRRPVLGYMLCHRHLKTVNNFFTSSPMLF